MSKRSFLRKSAVSLAATLGVGALGSAVSAQDIVLPPNLTIGTRNIEGTGVLRGAYYDDTATTPVPDQGVSYNYLGGPNSVVNGTFRVQQHANGIWRITL